MFKLTQSAHGFLEYVDIGEDEAYGLRYIRRETGGVSRPVMIPAGPKDTYDDYKQFVKKEPAGTTIKKACYPAEAELKCIIPNVTIDGACGNASVTATAGTYATITDIAAGDFCASGSKANVTQTATEITWECKGLGSGAGTATCSHETNIIAECGSRHDQTYDSLLNLTTGGNASGELCGANSVLKGSVAENSTTYNWTCEHTSGNAAAQDTTCYAHRQYLDCNGTALPQGTIPDGQECPPTDSCFFYVTGAFVGHENILDENGIDSTLIGQIGKHQYRHIDIFGREFTGEREVSDLVGPGEYPQSSPHTGYSGITDLRSFDGYSQEDYPFLHADSLTFDGLAMGPDTHVTIYSEENFGGTVLFEHQGALMLNNSHIKNLREAAGYVVPDDWLTATLPAPYNDMLPPSTRKWSTENMQPWGRGTSVKVTCTPPTKTYKDVLFLEDSRTIMQVAEDRGFAYTSGAGMVNGLLGTMLPARIYTNDLNGGDGKSYYMSTGAASAIDLGTTQASQIANYPTHENLDELDVCKLSGSNAEPALALVQAANTIGNGEENRPNLITFFLRGSDLGTADLGLAFDTIKAQYPHLEINIINIGENNTSANTLRNYAESTGGRYFSIVVNRSLPINGVLNDYYSTEATPDLSEIRANTSPRSFEHTCEDDI